MSKHRKYPLREALERGESYTWTVQGGGDLASMRKAIRHGQTLTMSPVGDPSEIEVGNIVLVKWHGGDILHLVGEIRDGRYLIVNSMGGENGWVDAQEILGRVTAVVEPEPQPEVPAMLDMLEAACRHLAEVEGAPAREAARLLAMVEDLRWYADRLGPERWDVVPRSNKWSFQQNLWWLTKKIRDLDAPAQDRLHYLVDAGVQITGLAAEIFAWFEYGESVSA